MKKILYIDMDGVLVDFEAEAIKIPKNILEKYGKASKVPDIFKNMKPIKGSIEAFNELQKYFEVYILSSPSWENPSSRLDKILWVKKYLGEKARKKLILSHRKDLNIGDFLVDDRTKNGAGDFNGEHILFGGKGFENWDKVLEYLVRKK